MSSNKDMYRNPPAPLGYIQQKPPGIVRNAGIVIDGKRYDCIEFLISSGILDVPLVPAYDHFTINSSSDEEIVEIPLEQCAKQVESIVLSDEEEPVSKVKESVEIPAKPFAIDVSSNEEPVSKAENVNNISSKKELVTKACKDVEPKIKVEPEACSKTLKDLKKSAVDSPTHKEKTPTPKTKVERESCIEKSKKKNNDKKIKREDDDSEHSRKIKQKETCDYDDEDLYKKKKNKRKDDFDSDTSSYRKSKHKKIIDYEISDDSDSNDWRYEIKKRDEYEDDKRKIFKRREKKRSDYDYDSDSSSHTSKPKDKYSYDDEDYSRKHARKQRSQSPASNDDYQETMQNIKQEYPSISGVYFCKVCNLTLNSYSTYQSHMAGKRHKKALDAKNVSQAVAKTYIPTKAASKCPRPAHGFVRVSSSDRAKIQSFIDEKFTIPIPGLHYVLEIHGVTETSYYCSLCDAPCNVNSILPHLRGFKHQLNILKHYDSNLYEMYCYKQKYQVEHLVEQKLRDLERKHGRGSIKVEKDIPESAYSGADIPKSFFYSPERPLSSRDEPSTSRQLSGADFSEIFKSSSIPDPSKHGFYCKICDSHSNSRAMWDAHINGKRHIANLKKAPGTAPSKSKNIRAPPGVRPKLLMMLEDVDEPVVGLSQIREIQKKDIDSVSYNCFLCSACVPEFEIVDHIVSRKHREKYLEKIQFEGFETLKNCQVVSEHSLHSLIADLCAEVEANEGRGDPEVYYAKNSLIK